MVVNVRLKLECVTRVDKCKGKNKRTKNVLQKKGAEMKLPISWAKHCMPSDPHGGSSTDE